MFAYKHINLEGITKFRIYFQSSVIFYLFGGLITWMICIWPKGESYSDFSIILSALKSY